ncbi:mediator of RNA polymerase II transcription subunit 6-like [Symsagittifera roscoffensis]|uniref:mediator of RNA polymerase II transcription subunit 6-like n=1 Tax=Symsagittifera roscoffensis TaxID=84072 RepID=UPI00307B4F89
MSTNTSNQITKTSPSEVLNELNSEFVKSWHDVALVSNLTRANVMMYFTQRSNPFYDRRSNNELLKHPHNKPMDLLRTMQGLEYDLIYEEAPILFVVQKRKRHSPTQVTPIANYYIIAGDVYRAPDLNRILSSRLATSCDYLNEAFQELTSTDLLSSENDKDESESSSISGSGSTSIGGIRCISSKDEKEFEKSRLVTSFQIHRIDGLLNSMMNNYVPVNLRASTLDIKNENLTESGEGSANEGPDAKRQRPN